MNLVVGATGSLGSHTALRLVRSDERVRALVREGSQYSQLQAAGAEIALGDLKNRRSLDRACVGVRRVIATATAAGRGGKDTIETVDREGYANLLAAAEGAGVRQFVFVSAHGFNADSPSALARAKAATEEALRTSDLNFTILRPALFMESWIGQILGAQLHSGPKVVVMGDPDRQLPFVSATNVADLAIAVLDHPDARRASISLSTQMASYRQLVDWIRAATGREIELESVPPGTPIPGMPPLIVDLWTMLSTVGVPALETLGVAVNYGLKLVSVKAFIERTFGAASSSV
jgi:uncharacterized protein YbjT (DUF2867 family)